MDVAELARQIDYKVAPEPLIAVQGLANTFAYEPGEERLGDAASARGLAARVGSGDARHPGERGASSARWSNAGR